MFGAARRWVYTHRVAGRFQRAHRWSGVLLQAFFLVVPWLQWNGHALARIDLPSRRITLAGSAFTPSDTFFLFLMLVIGAFGVFFVTAAFGRAWCGWGCPQTVFLEEWVRPIEQFVEGERGVRIRRDQGPWTLDRTGRKLAKWALFAVAAVIVGVSFASWFNDPRLLWAGEAGPVATGFAAALSGVMFLDFAWFREQFCSYLCPYARLQGALTDPESVVIAYDAARGEPRGPRRKTAGDGTAATGGGTHAVRSSSACIDCGKCVTVCPAGIDIRDGFQLECIACARCVDACEGVMGRLGEPSLVRYAPERPRFVRPRTVAYGGMVLLASCVFVWQAFMHASVQVNVNRAPGSLYVVDPDGAVRNTFLVRIANNDLDMGSHTYTLSVRGLPAAAESITVPATVDAGKDATVPLVVRMPPDGARTHTFHVDVDGGERSHRATVATTFKGE
jgi:cytochrome c oxidase accessory protein FixG